jgi:hypothetical protein
VTEPRKMQRERQTKAQEAVMTEPRDMHRERQTNATTADPEPEVRPELIKDLDVSGDDAGDIAGGSCSSFSNHPTQ